MKNKLFKLVSHLLTMLIIIQAVLCFALLYRTAADKDMAILGYRFYYIVSPSMEPTIGTGSEIVVKEVDTDSLEVGDIITFASSDPAIQGYPNTHRIMEVTTDEHGSKAFVTKGDNNPMIDQYLVYPKDIYGKVVFITPTLKGLIMFYQFAATPSGFMVVVVMPLLLVFGAFFRSFIREFKAAIPGGGKEDAAPQLDMSPAEVEAFVAAIVANYMKEHPGENITPEDAAKLAAGLVEITKEKGKEESHGKQ